MTTTAWIKAQASNGGGACVELRRHQAAVQVRDSKQGEAGPILQLSPAQFAAWLDAAKSGELTHLL